MTEPSIQKSELKKACKNCGAELKYRPGTTTITCEYCGNQEQIALETDPIKELPLRQFLQEKGAQANSEEISILHCKNCGANQHVEDNYKSLHCVYCGTPLIREDAKTEQWILPGAVLPFQLTQQEAILRFKKWVNGLWWAPNDLKKATLDPQFTKGLYLPYWTFDAQLYGQYSGARGDYYYETQSYKDSKGRRRTRRVRKTRWIPISGNISGFVDDTLINASKQHTGKVPRGVALWNLKKLQPFESSFLAGFVTEKYTIPLKDGHLESQEEMRRIADTWARRDIGGDEQRVNTLNINLEEETFKHILLPVYISAYRYKGKEYSFFVNGENGSISGKRPYSFWKIFFAVLAGILLFGLVYLFSK